MEKDFWATTDLNLSSTLLSLGFTCSGIDVDPKGRAKLFFEKNKKLVLTVNDYWSKKLRVEPIDLFSARKEILNRIKNEENTKKSN